MRLLVVSDTHGNRAGILQALAEAGKIDMLLHCGDGASDACVAQSLIDGGAYAVRGNCDFAAGDPYQRVLAVEDKKILILHGHRQRVKETLFDLYDLGVLIPNLYKRPNNPFPSVIPVTGILARMQPKPIGSSRTGSYSFTTASVINTRPTPIIRILPQVRWVKPVMSSESN
jgi:hypothetical protein